MRNYHKILSVILAELIDCQLAGGISTTISINGFHQQVTMKVPIAFIVGDCKGNDRLCGRYGTHNLGNALVCRDCDCLTEDANDPLIDCQPLLLEMFNVDDHDPDALSHISHHNIDNAFHKACFGGDKEGVHGCTPPEMLYLYQQGLYKYALEAFVDMMT